MNEQMIEYIRLREQIRQLQQRQGEAAWLIIERVIEDLAEHSGKIDQKEPIK